MSSGVLPFQSAPRMRAVFLFFSSFALAKGGVVFAPLILAGLVGREVYGAFEWSISMGQLFATVLSGFVVNALPVLMLQRNPPWVADVKALALLVISLVGGAAGVALGALGKPVAALAACAVVFVSAQQVMATYLQAKGKREAGVLWSSFATMGTAALFVAGRDRIDATLWICVAGVALVMVAAAFDLKAHRHAGLGRRTLMVLRRGAPQVGYGVVAVWLASSGRVYVGAWLGLAEVAAYGLGFRLASLLLLPNAIFLTAFFVRFFQMRARAFDRFASAYLAVTAVGAVLLTLLAAFALPRYGALWFQVDVAAVARIFPLLSMHVVLWIATAALTSRVNKMKLGFPATVAAGGAGLFGLAATAALGWFGLLSLMTVSVVLIAQEAFHLFGQAVVLRQRKMAFPRIFGVVAAAEGLLAALAVLL